MPTKQKYARLSKESRQKLNKCRLYCNHSLLDHDLRIKLVKRSRINRETFEPQHLRRLLLNSIIALVLFTLLASLVNQNSNTVYKLQIIGLASGHIVLTKDDRGQSLVLTGEDGKGGKGGKGKGKGEGGDRLVISGNNMGEGGQNSNMIMEDASNREGDVVINGNSMIIPGEDGHIVLSDTRRQGGGGGGSPGGGGQLPINPLIYWLPYMNSRYAFRMLPFFAAGGQFG